MGFFPLRQIPGLAWPEIPGGGVSQLWGLCLNLEETQWLYHEEIVAGQLAQLRALLAHCNQNVPYYQELFRKSRIKPGEIKTLDDFRRIPILNRVTYQEQFARFQARALPEGIAKTNEDHSSGTSGVTIPIWQTNLVDLWWCACYLRDLQWAGIDPRGRLASIRLMPATDDPARGFVLSSWSPNFDALMKTGPLYGLDSRQPPRRQLEWLFEVQPDYLLCSVAIGSFLASLLAEEGRRIPSLRAVQVLSETLSPEAQTRMEAGFGVPVKNLYSCTEAGYLASVCPDGHGLHVHAENVLLEVLDTSDQPCRPGETGRVVLTTLHNHITPFVRYDILDTATVGPAPCPCGRGLPLLTRVDGKAHPILKLSGDRVVSSRAVIIAIENLGLSRQHQVVQKALDRVVIRIVPNRSWQEDSSARVVEAAHGVLPADVHVEVNAVERLELTPGGKLRDVVVELGP